MDRISELADQLANVLEALRAEAAARDARALDAPIAWLDEANYWLKVEVQRTAAKQADAVPFTYIPATFQN